MFDPKFPLTFRPVGPTCPRLNVLNTDRTRTVTRDLPLHGDPQLPQLVKKKSLGQGALSEHAPDLHVLANFCVRTWILGRLASAQLFCPSGSRPLEAHWNEKCRTLGYFRLGSEQAHVLQPIAEPNIKNALKWLYYTTNTHIRLYL